MESLRHLEDIHGVLHLMNHYSIASSPQDRFLAEFLLFLATTCKEAEEIASKCKFLHDKLPQIVETPSLLQELTSKNIRKGLVSVCSEFGRYSQSVTVSGEHIVVSPLQKSRREIRKPVRSFKSSSSPNCDMYEDRKFSTGHSLRGATEIATPVVSLRAMERANSTLEDFCKSYFMFHTMDVSNPRHLFKHLPILAFVEGYIYQLDGENEEQLLCFSEDATLQQSSISEDGFATPSVVDPFEPLRRALKARNLLTERIEEEFRGGVEYWALEKSLCVALLRKEEISISDVLRASRLKSFDYRVLNLLLYRLTNKPVNNLHMEFLSMSEFLVEVSDDLFDYEEDVLNNNFNILRMFLKIYGPSEAPSRLAHCIGETEEQYQQLMKKLELSLQTSYRKRCEEAVAEGGKVSGYSMGSWTIPPLIIDEEGYRSNIII